MARYQVGIRTEAKILDATKELLAERGWEATTLKAICDRAGVQAGSFYNLFSSKEEVVLRVVRNAIEAVDPDPDAAGRDTVDELVEAYIAFISDEPDLSRIYVQIAINGGLGDPGAGNRFLRHHERRVERFGAALERSGVEPADAEPEAEVLLGALDGLAFRRALDPSFDFAAHAHLAAKRFRKAT